MVIQGGDRDESWDFSPFICGNISNTSTELRRVWMLKKAVKVSGGENGASSIGPDVFG